MYRLLLFLFLASFASACIGSKTNPRKCKREGTVSEFVPACGFVIRTDDGKEYLIAERKSGLADLEPGQRVSFNARKIAGDPCRVNRKAYRLTCLRVLGPGRPQPLPCADVSSPHDVEWMLRARQQHAAITIEKHTFRDGYAYLFWNGLVAAVYDCQGTFLCTYDPEVPDRCHLVLNEAGKGLLIWRAAED